MRNRCGRFWGAAAAAVMLAGCGHMAMDLTPEGNPDRVLTGAVNFENPVDLPGDAVVVVRVLGFLPINPAAVAGVPGAAPAAGSQAETPPQVLGEQTIRNPSAPPVAFRIEYQATDDQLRMGLKLEARVSYGGKVRWFNVNGYSVNLNNVGDPHSITVDPAER
jgi:uncharacterized lipoprotein YbaY